MIGEVDSSLESFLSQNSGIEEKVYFKFVFTMADTDDAICYNTVILDDHDNALFAQSTFPLNETFIVSFLDVLDDNKFPWREVWDFAEKEQVDVTIYYLISEIVSVDKEKSYVKSKMCLICDADEEVHTRLDGVLGSLDFISLKGDLESYTFS